MCDEPFVPAYPRRCEWCGHTFADGYEVDVVAAPAAEEQGIDRRIIMVILAILAWRRPGLGGFSFCSGGRGAVFSFQCSVSQLNT